MALYSLHQAMLQQSLTWHSSQLNPAGDASAAVDFWTMGVWAVEDDSVARGASTRGSERDLQVDRTWEVLSYGSVLPVPAREFAGPSLWRSSKVGLTCLTLSDEVMTVRSLNLAPKHWAASREFWNASSLLLQQWFLLQAGIEKCMKKQSGSCLSQPCNCFWIHGLPGHTAATCWLHVLLGPVVRCCCMWDHAPTSLFLPRCLSCA